MAENIVASRVSSGGGPEFIRSRRSFELVKLTGTATAAGDTSTAYICQFVKNPAFAIGPVTTAITGQSVVFTSLVALGSADMYVWLVDAI
jgi:hypothetical protein